MLSLSPLYCSASDEPLYAYGAPITVPVDSDPAKPLPREIVWVPAGEHDICAHGAGMQPVQARVLGDEHGARAIQTDFETVKAAGGRVYLDRNHDDADATGDVRAFSWDPARGIVATVDWTPYGERLLRERTFCSFSPAFLRNKATGRPARLIAGHAAGGLVNAPAFGAAMPALIAARLAGAELHATPVLAGSASDSSRTMNKELLIKLLAGLGVTLAPDATPADTDAAITQALGKATAPVSASHAAPGAAELEALRAQLSTVRKDKAKTAVDAAIARGALPAKDEAIHAKWMGLIEADPTHEQLLASMPGNAALQRVTTPGAGIVQVRDGAVDVLRALAATPISDTAKRAAIYGRDIAPLFAKDGFQLGPILAVNSLGTLSGELITQRSLSLLKRTYPALSAISTDFTSEGGAFGQTVSSRLRSLPLVTEYDPDNGGYQTSSATVTDVPVVISGHKAVQISFNANELARTDRDLFGEQSEGSHAAIAADLFDVVLGVITPANFTNESVIALNSFSRASMSTISKALTTRHAPRAGRFGLLNLDYYEKLGQDSNIVTLAAYQKPEVITEGELPRIAKIQPYEVEDFPSDDSLVGFAGAADALILATRVPGDYTKVLPGANGGGVVQYITNPDLGFTVMLVQYIDHKAGTATWRLAYMRGAAKGNASNGQRIVSAATSS